MSKEMTELKLRVEAKKKDLEAQIAKFRADSMGKGNDVMDALQKKLSTLKEGSLENANEALDSLQKRLNSLEGDLKSGWDNVSEAVAGKLNRWLSTDDKDKD